MFDYDRYIPYSTKLRDVKNEILKYLLDNSTSESVKRKKRIIKIGISTNDDNLFESAFNQLIQDKYVATVVNKDIDDALKSKLVLDALNDGEPIFSSQERYDMLTEFVLSKKGIKVAKKGGIQPPKEKKVKKTETEEERRERRNASTEALTYYSVRLGLVTAIIGVVAFILKIFDIDLLEETRKFAKWVMTQLR